MNLAEYGDGQAAAGQPRTPRLTRLYADARSGSARAAPHPPEGVVGVHPPVGGALAPPCASLGDTARSQRRSRLAFGGPAVTVFRETYWRPDGAVATRQTGRARLSTLSATSAATRRKTHARPKAAP
jgi:hypothetical protein